MKFTIDLANHSDRTFTQTRWGLSLLILLTGIGLGLSGLEFTRSRGQVLSLEAAFHSRPAPSFSRTEWTRLQAEISAANAILGRRAALTVDLLNEIEKAVPWGTTITRLQYTKEPPEVLLNGFAKGLSTLSKLTTALQDSPRFSGVTLTRQDENSDGGIGFDIRLRFLPAGEGPDG